MNEIRQLAQREGLDLRPAGKAHARELGRSMKLEDRREIQASGGFTIPEKAVRAAINCSVEAWAAYAGGDLVAVFGVRLQRDPRGDWWIPWMMVSEKASSHPLTVWRASRPLFNHLRSKYPRMVQMVHARYVSAIRWVEKLGFKIGQPEPFGVEQALFCQISVQTPQLEVARV